MIRHRHPITDSEIVQDLKRQQATLTHRIQPGQKLWELVVYTMTEDRAQGWSFQPDPFVKGEGEWVFDPEKAEVREVKISQSVIVVGMPVVPGLGAVKPGVKRKATEIPGNFYWPAINAKTARKKIIRNFFQ